MRCRNCGHTNPADNNYCGRCGKLLLPAFAGSQEPVIARAPAGRADAGPSEPMRSGGREASAERRALAPEEAAPVDGRLKAPASEPIVGGPSFLGLSGPADGQGSYQYLLEEDEPQSHTGRYLSLLLLAALVGVAVWQWQPIRDYAVASALHYWQAAQRTPEAAQPAQTPTESTPGAPAIPGPPAQSSEATSADTPAAAPGARTEGAQNTPAGPSGDKSQPAAAHSPEPAQQPQAGKAQGSASSSGQQRDEETAAAGKSGDTSTHVASRAKPQKTTATPRDDRDEQLLATGEKYLYGRGAAKNCQQALVYFRAAADHDSAGALSRLGALYATGECVPLNRARAYGFFRRALQLDRGNTYLEHNLTMLWREMSDAERQTVLRAQR